MSIKRIQKRVAPFLIAVLLITVILPGIALAQPPVTAAGDPYDSSLHVSTDGQRTSIEWSVPGADGTAGRFGYHP